MSKKESLRNRLNVEVFPTPYSPQRITLNSGTVKVPIKPTRNLSPQYSRVKSSRSVVVRTTKQTECLTKQLVFRHSSHGDNRSECFLCAHVQTQLLIAWLVTVRIRWNQVGSSVLIRLQLPNDWQKFWQPDRYSPVELSSRERHKVYDKQK